jgi:hypothetical protein
MIARLMLVRCEWAVKWRRDEISVNVGVRSSNSLLVSLTSRRAGLEYARFSPRLTSEENIMSLQLRGTWAVGILSLFVAATVWAQEDMVPNPYYKFWSGSKPGATAVHVERTKLSGPEGKLLPGGVDEKRIVYKLLDINDDRAVVQMIVTEPDFIGEVESAPTRHIYPVKLKKANLERILSLEGNQTGEETVTLGAGTMKCKTISGTIKEPDGELVEFKLWLADVPGSIVKQVRTARQKDAVIAETTITLESHKKAD